MTFVYIIPHPCHRRRLRAVQIHNRRYLGVMLEADEVHAAVAAAAAAAAREGGAGVSAVSA